MQGYCGSYTQVLSHNANALICEAARQRFGMSMELVGGSVTPKDAQASRHNSFTCRCRNELPLGGHRPWGAVRIGPMGFHRW